MRRFYAPYDLAIDDRWHIGEILDADGGYTVLDSCDPYRGRLPLQAEVQYPGPMLDFTVSARGLLVVSRLLAQAIEHEAPDDVELLPAFAGAEKVWVVNVLRAFPCIDDVRSNAVRYEEPAFEGDPRVGRYRSVFPLVIHPEVIPPEVHVFYPRGWSVVLVSKEMKAALETTVFPCAKFFEVGYSPS